MPILIGRPKQETELMKTLSQYSRNHNWIKDNYTHLLGLHPRKYIAVRAREVMYVADSMEEIISAITDEGKIPGDYAIDYLTDEECNFLF